MAEPQVALVSPITVATVAESEVLEVVEVVTTIETSEPSIEIVESEQEITITEEEQTDDDIIGSHDITNIGPAVSKAYLNSIYINMAVVWFVVITLLAGLFIGFELRKRR